MSFPRRALVSCAPSRQRGAIGLMAALTLGLALLSMVVVVDSGRLYLAKRSLQRVADTAALEAVTRGGNCQAGLSAATYATQSANRNSFVVGSGNTLATACGTLVTGANNLRTFTVDASKSDAIRVIAKRSITTSIAAGIGALFSGGPTNLNTQLTATAVAATPLPYLAQLNIRSTLLSVDTTRSNTLNQLFSGLLGGSVNISTAGWDGLVKTDINLLSYMNQLALSLGVTAGDYNALLNTQASLTTFIKAAADVLNINGGTASVTTALGNLQLAATGANPIKLGDLLKLQTGTLSNGLNADVQLFQLIQAFIQLANKNGAAAATLPVNVLGIAGVTTTVGVIQPPQLSAIGDPRLAKLNPTGANQIYVQTGQIRALISINLSLINTVLQLVNTTLSGVVTAINTLLAPGCLLGGTCTQTDLKLLSNLDRLDVGLEIGIGASRLTDYNCPVNGTGSKSLSANTTTAAGALKIGRIDKTIWFSGSSAESVTPLTLVDIGSKVCQGSNCGVRTPFAGGGSELIVNIPLDQTTIQNMLFTNPPNVNSGQTLIQSVPRPTAQGVLTNSLNNPTLIIHSPTLSGGLLGTLLNTLLTTLSQTLTTLMTAITGLLSSLITPLINNLLLNLGIDINNVSVGANLTCGQTGKAYLVI
ncbi:pilus assembly protein TadG-related protein [Pseudomonas asplenii]|uniref:pilus assembly protein TadG-related protein n=1 Tax=Pseudomonas asplenii TaxID=53407 RepID=UPI00036A48D4|nr:pilus assembly protein TadG-related protein [Pseudomonas fuscovaginae]